MRSVHSLRVVVLSLVCGGALVFVGCDSGGTNGGSQPPTADITVSSSTVDAGTQVVLDGSASSDPDGDALSYSWSLDTPSGSNASLSDPSAEKPTFTPDVGGDYVAGLEVSDGDATASSSETITAQTSTVQLSGTITTDSTLTAAQNYVVTGGLTISNDATLTIEPGVHLPFQSGAGLYVDPDAVLDADGTSGEPITMTATTGNEQSGWWQGVFSFSAEPNNLLDHVEVRHAGSGSPSTVDDGGVVVAGGSALTVTNSTIAQSGADGLLLHEENSTLDGFSNNTFSGNAEAPVNIPFTNIGAIDGGSTVPDGKTVKVWGGTISGSRDVTVNALDADTPYRFARGATIGASSGGASSVTINPGVEMTFEADAGLYVSSGSVLSADGTADNPITMTATEGNAQPGWWQGVFVFSNDANNLLDHVEVRHTGSGSPNTVGDGGVVVAGGSAVTLTNSTIAQSAAYGLLLTEGNATLDGFSANTFADNADAPIYLPFSNIGRIDGTTTFPDGKTVRVFGTSLSEDGATDVTLTALSGDTPYRFASSPAVGDDASMTIEPGVEMTFESDVGFRVSDNSSLTADGTSETPITMTATAGNAQQGWWRGIAFYSDNANNLLNHVEVRHAGRSIMSPIPEAANVAISVGASLDITNSTVTDSGNHGIYCDPPSSATLSGNTYQNNAGQNTEECP
ncbi:PKD domain-containing protein [Salinibacter ruber]|uniref:PKD/Chitinase domain-containing protein n=1 Tax=Salinibacter ruber TaxID=146919 RepID=A0A9X2Z4U4_9BACT|nr:PKD domain-containing protein [Salinibacter ruber]MCS3657756.1 hypothetical protein [Salinibacter ruber]MCS3952879.1 hypothetical protein [Salinibacter ruber]MCS4119094.1 hypothetical protein [Salinibacter ruber]MCS4155400.1 hypothetical protein [Salinibacter ruber]MCS4171573.1 hypothetical protein [Salinibacter ruber]